jgi:tRNA1Val (adenine37-N6)-methyltransferase
MKVCTDACLFGAWISEEVKTKNLNFRNVLDAGTGTGLLSLMFAQKNLQSIIDAVEIDEAAAQQARENFEASPWKERLQIYSTSIKQFNAEKKYDLIISNPPFFENDLKSDDSKRNLALHSSQLSLEELLDAITKHLKEDGLFAVLLSFHRTEQFINLSIQRSFHLIEKVLVKQTPKHHYFRSILLFSKESTHTKESEIIIQNDEGKYTEEFVQLLKDYYLYL